MARYPLAAAALWLVACARGTSGDVDADLGVDAPLDVDSGPIDGPPGGDLDARPDTPMCQGPLCGEPVYVSAALGKNDNPGTAQEPVATIAAGIERAVVGQRPV